MKGQKYDEARAGVEDFNFGQIPLQEAEYYDYRNWLEPYLLDNPDKSDLSEEELMKIFRNLHPAQKDTVLTSDNNTNKKSPEAQTDDLKPWEGPVPGDPESLT